MLRSLAPALALSGLFCVAMPTAAHATPITILANNPGTWNQWIDTGLDLLPGELLQITAGGAALTSGFQFHGPDGKSTPGPPNATESLVNTVNVGALVGMIDSPPGSIPFAPPFNTAGMYLLDDPADNSPFFGPGFVGSSFSQVVPAGVAGRLYLGFNDGFDADNLGSYDVNITVTSAVPEPATLSIVGVGLGMLVARRRNRLNRRVS